MELERLKHAYSKMVSTPIYSVLRHNPVHHWHCQAFSIPSPSGFKESALKTALRHGVSLVEEEPSLSGSFALEYENVTLSANFPQGSYFPVQLARLVIADYLNLSSSDWRTCSTSEAEETLLVQKLKSRFLP